MISDRDFVQSLARGLAVLRGFAEGGQWMTLAEVAKVAGVSRPAARRLLLTLQELGYVQARDGSYALAPRVLTLGQAYLASTSLVDIAEPHMRRLAAQTGEAAAMTSLDEGEIVYIARVGAERIMSSVLVVGSRLEAYATSMGRVLLAQLPVDRREAILSASTIRARTERTVTDVGELLKILDQVERQGWALVDQELEAGLRSVAAPIFDQSGSCVAAIASSCHASRVSAKAIVRDVLPAVRETAASISADLGYERSSSAPRALAG